MAEMGWRGWNERLREVYAGLGPHMTQEAFGDMVGERKGVVGNWLRGGIVPSLEQFERIAEATKTEFLWLVCGHDCDAPAVQPGGLDHETVRRVATAVFAGLARRKIPQIIPDELARVITGLAIALHGKPETIIRTQVETTFESNYGKLKP